MDYHMDDNDFYRICQLLIEWKRGRSISSSTLLEPMRSRPRDEWKEKENKDRNRHRPADTVYDVVRQQTIHSMTEHFPRENTHWRERERGDEFRPKLEEAHKKGRATHCFTVHVTFVDSFFFFASINCPVATYNTVRVTLLLFVQVRRRCQPRPRQVWNYSIRLCVYIKEGSEMVIHQCIHFLSTVNRWSPSFNKENLFTTTWKWVIADWIILSLNDSNSYDSEIWQLIIISALVAVALALDGQANLRQPAYRGNKQFYVRIQFNRFKYYYPKFQLCCLGTETIQLRLLCQGCAEQQRLRTQTVEWRTSGHRNLLCLATWRPSTGSQLQSRCQRLRRRCQVRRRSKIPSAHSKQTSWPSQFDYSRQSRQPSQSHQPGQSGCLRPG